MADAREKHEKNEELSKKLDDLTVVLKMKEKELSNSFEKFVYTKVILAY